jgi:hypothetical protein
MAQAAAVIQEANQYLDHDNDHLDETQSCSENMYRIRNSLQHGVKAGPLFVISYSVHAWETSKPDGGTDYIASLSHNAETDRLIVELADGQEYQYGKVRHQDFVEFTYAQDPRHHHLHEVIGKFPRIPV